MDIVLANQLCRVWELIANLEMANLPEVIAIGSSLPPYTCRFVPFR